MKIKKLEVAGLRAFPYGEFTFQPGMNLLVGVNGVGKTTILDALRISLSRILPEITSSRSRPIPIEESDLKVGSDTLKIVCNFEVENKGYQLLITKQRINEVIENDEEGKVRYDKHQVPDLEEVSPKLSGDKKSPVQPLAIHFSTRRSIASNREPERAEGGQAAAFSDSLSPSRDFNLREIAFWLRAQSKLAEEIPKALSQLNAMYHAARVFLPDCDNLHWIEDSSRKVYLQIDKNGVPLNVAQLSDGERGMLALALDLARRLSQANPGLENPVKDGKAIVLIDEIDLHLHPKWQRTIVNQLTSTFPNCQFIASTHSPQIIPSVEPEQVLLMKDQNVIYPNRTYGMDTNWILEFIMESGSRPDQSSKAIKEVEDLIKKGKFKEARVAMIKYKEEENIDLPEWNVFEARIAKMEIFKNR